MNGPPNGTEDVNGRWLRALVSAQIMEPKEIVQLAVLAPELVVKRLAERREKTTEAAGRIIMTLHSPKITPDMLVATVNDALKIMVYSQHPNADPVKGRREIQEDGTIVYQVYDAKGEIVARFGVDPEVDESVVS